jgi:hypothetical protein
MRAGDVINVGDAAQSMPRLHIDKTPNDQRLAAGGWRLAAGGWRLAR